MFFTDKIGIEFHGLNFVLKAPNNQELTDIFVETTALIKDENINPQKYERLAKLTETLLIEKPENFDNFPESTKLKLLFDIGKYIVNEQMEISDIKKK